MNSIYSYLKFTVVDRTPGWGLISALRKKEINLQIVTGKRIKLVERTGQQLKSMIWKADPWGGIQCWDLDCPVCEHEQKKRICRVSNVVYISTCMDCQEEGRKCSYIGETSRSLAERAREHKEDAGKTVELSHIRDHKDAHHRKVSRMPRMKYKIDKRCKSALERQVREAVIIKLQGREGVIY